jgi:luciferase family oxidoreductase group 1
VAEPSIRLSLLDFSWAYHCRPAEALWDTLAVGVQADSLGYARYWLGEHHVEGHASGSPQVLAGILATSTKRMRIGIGAMLLHYWAPLKVAEDFLLLEALFGRIDLGVGRGRADNLQSHRALLDGRPGDDAMLGAEAYSAKLDDLVAYVRGTIPAGHPHYGAAVIPDIDSMPEMWLCGSATAASEAARTGTRFCCTLFHGSIAPPIHVQTYRRCFRPSADLEAPHAAIAVAGVCADTEAEAVAIREVFPNPNYVPSVVGTAQQCRSRIEQFCEAYDVDEVVILDIAANRSQRIRSAELLAQAFGLQP